MIITEFYEQREDGVNLYRTYSDSNFKIMQDQTGIIYDDAVDVEDAPYTYTETNIPIDPIDDPTLPDAPQFGRALIN